MNKLESLSIPDFGTLKVAVTGGSAVHLSGSIAMKDPRTSLTPFFRTLHEAACDLPAHQLDVDVSALRFVSSSAIRVFLDWVTWVQQEPNDRRYKLCFRTDSRVSWQRVSLPVLVEFADNLVSVEPVAEPDGRPG
ncbi:MAG TPA: hypothetical protein PLU22_10155 [Polyangiaceae bacterium]|nr:hypothetical protein [Polyangiaceae bacterium]